MNSSLMNNIYTFQKTNCYNIYFKSANINQMSEQSLIDLAELVEDLAKLVLKCSLIIKEISQNFNQVFYKDHLNDPVTQADYLVQQTIETFINNKYPGLRIVGEENLKADDEICKNLQQKGHTMNAMKTDLNLMVENYPFKKETVYLKVSQLCIWIDPLDCTRGFVSNKKQEVTILVGITENHKPIAGIIGQPFKLKSDNNCEFDPRIFIGSHYFNAKNQKKFCFEYLYFKKSWKKWQQFHQDKHSHTERKVAISSRRVPLRQHQLMKTVKMQKHQIGGAGSKFIKLIQKQVGALMFVDAKTSKWDSCAGQAIIRSMGGFSIKPNLEQISYNPNEEYHNNEGFIVSLSKNFFKEIKEYISSQNFQNFEVVNKKQNLTLVS